MDISVIIPTYKPKQYLFELLDSLENQSLDLSKFELLIILNGEKEPYYTGIDRYLKTKKFNSFLLYSDWGNVSNARNTGLDNAKGEYIAFIDDDDVVSPNYLEELLKKATNTGIAVSNSKVFSTDLRDAQAGYYSKKLISAKNTKETNIFKRRSCLSPVAFKLIHRDIIANRKFNTNFRNGQDTIFMFEISDRINKIFFCENAYYFIRERVGSACRTKTLRINCSNFHNGSLYLSKVYFHNITKYNFLLYISRIVAAFIWIFRSPELQFLKYLKRKCQN